MAYKKKWVQYKRLGIGFHLHSDAVQLGIQARWDYYRNDRKKNTLHIGLGFLTIQIDYIKEA